MEREPVLIVVFTIFLISALFVFLKNDLTNKNNTMIKSEYRLFCEEQFSSLEQNSANDEKVMNCINSLYIRNMNYDNLEVRIDLIG